MEKILPNYKNGSIVNLMSSIARGFNGKTQYGPLKGLDISQIKSSKNVVLIVLDGLGADVVELLSEKSVLRKNLKMNITSVFPSTTAAAITTFMTGKAPNEHGVLAWYIYSKELGGVIRPLPFDFRYGGPSFGTMGASAKEFFRFKSMFDIIKAKGYYIKHDYLSKSEYSMAARGKSHCIGYKNLDDLFKKIASSLTKKGKRRIIFAYNGDFDEYSHKEGKHSKNAKTFVTKVEAKLSQFIKKIKGTNTLILITADHGHMTSRKETRIDINKFKEIYDCLLLPLTGEKRAAFCYVKNDCMKKFKSLVKKRLGKFCEIYDSKELVKKKWFGLYKTHEKVAERLGDYILIMKEGYVMGDALFMQEQSKHVGDHGGVSKEEMIVPLIVIKSE